MSFFGRNIRIVGLGLAIGACVACSSSSPNPNPEEIDAPTTGPTDGPSMGPGAPLDVSWIHGSASCAANTDPPLQVFRLDDNTFILRQNKCIDYEGPFIYLLFGDQRVFMQDTGATASASLFPIGDTVRSIIDSWLAERGQSQIELVVTHSHGHGDHVAGDGQFSGQPNTTVVEANVSTLQSFFGIGSWPEQVASYDLGGRVLDVIPIPGHHSAHIAVYDRRTRILLTGDTLYAGRLYINDFSAYRDSISRLAGFAADKDLRYVLGTHIEMSNTPGMDYPLGATYQPDEHPLELYGTHLEELDQALRAMGQTPMLEVHDSFIIYPF